MKRRTFLSAWAGLTGALLIQPQQRVSSTANSKIEIGIIGSGGRGFFVAKKMLDNVGDRIQLVAAHDYFADRLERFQNVFDIPESRCHKGLNAYRDILQSNVDAVVITSPPYFHPQQTEEAVQAGKHIWLSKPVAVDVPGCKRIVESGKKAAGKLTLLVDFQSRNSPYFIEAVKRVHRGDIGELISGEAFNQFPRGGWWPIEGLTKTEARIRNWGTDPILSGDIIVEQAVHAMDIANWLVGAHPTRAFGTCGLKARLNAGANKDHFTIIYWYGDGPVLDLNVSQFTKGYENLGARFIGNNGVVQAHYRANDWGIGPISITGDHPWEGTSFDNTWDIGADNNCKDFVASIQSGSFINHAEYAAESTMTSILGREAAYRRDFVTWDEIAKENKAFEVDFSEE